VLIEYIIPATEEGDDSSLHTHLFGPMGLLDATYLCQKLPPFLGVSTAQIIQLRTFCLWDWPGAIPLNPITHPPQPKPTLTPKHVIIPGKKATKAKKRKLPLPGQASIQFPSI
jgi:hypothetical protein